MTNYFEYDASLNCYRIYFKKDGFFLIDEDDFKTVKNYSWFNGKRGYPITHIKENGISKTQPLHKLLFPNVGYDMDIDHINGNKMDNRRKNLRICTHQENMFNQKRRNTNSSGYIGVAFHKSACKYEAYITHGYKKHYLGVYDTAQEAALVRDKYAVKLYGEYARLNFPSVGCA